MDKIKKIKFFKKDIISNSKGNIMKYINKNDSHYIKFGEIYFTWVKKSNFKGWKFHKEMHMNLTVPCGNIKFSFYDKDSGKKKIFYMSEKKFGTLYVPPKIWFAFENIDKKKDGLVVNFANIVHDKNESINKDFDKI